MQHPVHVVIPFKHEGAKSRLSSVLSPEERRLLAFAMLKDVLSTVLAFGWATILCRPGLDIIDARRDVEILESELDLNDALNSLITEESRRGWPLDMLIVMADLALLTQNDVSGILNSKGDVVLCPGRGGGTNMILLRSPKFRTCYQGFSFLKHLDFASQAGLRVEVFESFRAGCDIDKPEDLAEILIHGQDQTKNLLRSFGFFLSDKVVDGCTRSIRPL